MSELGKCDCGCWDHQQIKAEAERLRQRETDLTSEARGLHEALRKETAEVKRLREALRYIADPAEFGTHDGDLMRNQARRALGLPMPEDDAR